MAIRCGFFNAQDHDRLYNASDFNEFFSTIKTDGIEDTGDKLEVIEGSGLNVVVGSGKCFFNNHWLYNDSAYSVAISAASPVAPRIDAIVVEVNDSDRNVYIKAATGTPDASPTAPELVNSGTVHQHALAYVYIDTGATEVGTITDARSEWSGVKASYDSELSSTSENAVQNKVLYEELQKQNNTTTTQEITPSTKLVTMNTLKNAMNRSTGLGSNDTNYTTPMVRGISAGTSDLTAGSSSLTSGAIYLVYQ